MKKIKKYLSITGIILFFSATISQNLGNNEFEIIPSATNSDTISQEITNIGSNGGQVIQKYKDTAYGPQISGSRDRVGSNRTIGDELASGILTRDSLLNYVAYLVRFLGQIGLLIGATMIVYAGYLYATTVFSGGNASQGKTAINRAIIGILVIIFSYAIIRLITSAFLT